MRINNFKPYSKYTLRVRNRAHAAQTARSVLGEHRHTAVVHQTIGSTSIKCTSSQLDTVNIPAFASVSTVYKQAFRIRKNGQYTHFSATLPLHAANRYLSEGCLRKCSPHCGVLINRTTSKAIKIISNSIGLAKPIWVKNNGNE